MGALIDWYNVQFYNREFLQSSCLRYYPHSLTLAESPVPGYETCDSLINSGSGSAVLEIAASGVDINKIVIGKPGSAQDVTNGGYVDPAALSTCLAQAKAKGWNAGVMAYQVCARMMTPASLIAYYAFVIVPAGRCNLDHSGQGFKFPIGSPFVSVGSFFVAKISACIYRSNPINDHVLGSTSEGWIKRSEERRNVTLRTWRLSKV